MLAKVKERPKDPPEVTRFARIGFFMLQGKAVFESYEFFRYFLAVGTLSINLKHVKTCKEGGWWMNFSFPSEIRVVNNNLALVRISSISIHLNQLCCRLFSMGYPKKSNDDDCLTTLKVDGLLGVVNKNCSTKEKGVLCRKATMDAPSCLPGWRLYNG